MHREQQIEILMERIANLEEKFAIFSNPSRQLSIEEKVDVVLKAKATGDKKKLRAAYKQINGR